jgi:23S rRNA (cytosine1962-C5)-methyltransferase
MDGYELLDFGGGARLERFGAFLTDRPAPAAFEQRSRPQQWAEADLRFDRDRGWSAVDGEPVPDRWTARVAGLELELRPTEAGQVGLFPEHLTMLPWLRDRVGERAERGVSRSGSPDGVAVLNLFAYTGLTTLALAGAGAAVAHVDASRPSVAWARRNGASNGLQDRSIRWLVDDALSFTVREIRRGRRYAGIVLDPPSYGHGARGRSWRLESDLGSLLAACARVVDPDGFVLLTAHSEGFGPDRLAEVLRDALPRRGSATDAGDLAITSADGRPFALGAFARWNAGAR